MKKKNRKIIIIILVIVLIIAITLFLLFGFKKFNSTVDNDNLEEKEEEIISSKLTDEEVNTLLDKIKIYDNYFITLVGNKKPIDMTNDEKFLFYMKNNYQKFNKGVSSKEIESYLKEYFGNSITYTPITAYLCPIDNLPLIVYDKATDLYKVDYSNHGHDGDAISRIYSYYIDGNKETNSKTTYKIRVRKAFSNYVTVGLTTRFYGNYNDAINNRNEIFDLYKIYGDENMDNEELAKRVKTQYEKYKGMFNIYTYIFETDNNIENSYLISLTK